MSVQTEQLSATEAKFSQDEELKRRYSPSQMEEPGKDVGVLDYLHHTNVHHLRSELLKQYAFLIVQVKKYLDVREAPLKRLSKDLATYNWIRLPQRDKSRQNESIYHEGRDYMVMQTMVIIACAESYNLVEDGEGLELLKNQGLHYEERTERQDFDDEYRPVKDSRGRRESLNKQKEKRRFISRAYMAVFGGRAVISPMLIMSLHPTRLTQLLTASLFVVVIALVLAWLMDDAEKKDMIAATAAYAAVFVVFVVFVGTATATT
ncbi:hypothetical protein BKA65DRAFT_486209 [Rhexocercosporidium sp. MPI-PUGE-AT-0058]|nr:hypothetical protein BKA65DRAFT_486209 [Rhexocercosporidium sp. MPI-PUGE-AT-0058]